MEIQDIVNSDRVVDSNRGICMDLLSFMRKDKITDAETYFGNIAETKRGNCPYKARCTRYAKTVKEHPFYVEQLNLF